MTQQPDTLTDQVGDYYDDIGDLVEIVGGNLHVGYWESDDDDTPFLEAMNRLTTLIGEKVAPRRGEHLLDVGCGVAEPAIRLAQRDDVTITGITVSGWQVEEAARRIAAAGLRGRVSVELADASSMPFEDGSFDAAFAFDSLPNSTDKPRWLGEVFRVLRPGGRFVFTEYLAPGELTAEEREILTGNAILDPPSEASEVLDLCRAAGFQVVECLDLSERVRRFYVEFFAKLAEQRKDLVSAYGEERISGLEQGIGAVFDVCRRKVGYLVLTCTKPAA